MLEIHTLYILYTYWLEGGGDPSARASKGFPNTRCSFTGGCRGYFRDPWLALNFLREMWLLLFYPREPWFVCYRDPWFHKYFPRDLWKRPHFPRENDEKCRKFSVLLNDLQRRISYATIQYFRYKYWCTLHTHRSYIIRVEWGDT